MPQRPHDRPAAHDAGDDASASLSRVVAECIDRWEDEGPAALDALCRAHPELADELRSRISRLGEAGLLGAAGDDGRLPERLGAFRILALLGRGAMGVVYLAEQEPLGRRVALKLVRPELLFFPGARERFRREVQAVARLSHPGIVPVFAGGEDRGIPYCAMEFVRGASLQDVLEELSGRDPAQLSGADLLAAVQAVLARRADADAPGPATSDAAARLSAGTWTAACLRVARAVAEALAHAHEHGVLHRDVKPGNVMLTRDGRVLLLDFGLAAAEGSARLTSSGGQIGSLAWMSPEALRADRAAVDARSDVYSLGATLYELLTLQTPFAGGGVDVTLARVLAGRAAPPRQKNAAIPRDAETVCLTAMDRDPARRYASAAAFAADLGNVLELRPIAARRPGAALRARRWAQRNPAGAAAVALGALLLVGGPLGYGVLQSRAAAREHGLNADLQSANTRLDGALAQSERDFRSALDAIDHVLAETAVDDLEDVPRMQRVRLSAIDRALELFTTLAQDHADDALVLGERAKLHEKRGEVLRDLGRVDDGLAEYRQAVELRRGLVASDPSPARQDDLANALNDAGKALFVTLKAHEALPYYADAIAALRTALAAEPDAPSRLRMLAVALANQAEARRALSDDAGADADLREGLQQLDRAQQLSPGDALISWTEGRLLGDIGLAARDADPAAALDWLQRALAAWRTAHAAAPDRRYYAYDVSSGLLYCGTCERDLRRFAESETHLKESAALVDDLLRDYPDAERYRLRRIDLLDGLAVTYGFAGDHARAGELETTSVAELQALCASAPERWDLQVAAAKSEVNLASSLIQRATDLGQARTLVASARARLARCAQADALPAENASMNGLALYLAALLECEDGQLDAARPAIAEFENQPASGASFERQCADLWNEWVLALRRTVPDPAARAAQEADGRAKFLERLTRAIDAGYADVNELRTTHSLDPFRADPDVAALIERAERSAKP